MTHPQSWTMLKAWSLLVSRLGEKELAKVLWHAEKTAASQSAVYWCWSEQRWITVNELSLARFFTLMYLMEINSTVLMNDYNTRSMVKDRTGYDATDETNVQYYWYLYRHSDIACAG